MKNILALIIALALSPHIFAETIKIDPSQEKDMWNSVWTRFFSPKTDVFYDLIVSLNPENSLDFVPTAEQIKKLAPANPNGYGTGMEDGMILGGIMMCAVLDKRRVAKKIRGRHSARNGKVFPVSESTGIRRPRRKHLRRKIVFSLNIARPIHPLHTRPVEILQQSSFNCRR